MENAEKNEIYKSIKTGLNSLNQNELENSLAYIREMIDISMNLNRDNLAQSHKQIALILEKHVNEIKLQRDKIIQIDVGNDPIPLHLICRNMLT